MRTVILTVACGIFNISAGIILLLSFSAQNHGAEDTAPHAPVLKGKSGVQMEKLFYNLHDLYEILPFGEKKIRRLLKNGEIPAIRAGRDYITTKEKLEEWFDENVGQELYY